MGYHSPPSSSVASGATGCHLMWLAGLLIATTLVVSIPRASHAQANDDCLLATGIAALPFVDVINTAAATSAVDDPTSICSGTENSVWYSYTAGANETLELDTIGSTYDTQLSVWDGACGALLAELGQKGLFQVRGGTLATLVISGTPAPAGGTIEHVGPSEPKFGGRARPSISRRRVAFRAEIDPGAPLCEEGIFIAQPTGLVEIARSGGVTPLGGTYGLLSPPTLVGTRLVFNSEESLSGECIFSATTAGVVGAVSCEGQAAPALVGGTLEQFETNATLSKRTPLFFVPLSGATVDECYLARTSSGLVPIACLDDHVPGGGTIFRLGIGTFNTPPYGAIRGPGSAFIVETTSDYSDTMLLAERKGVIWPVARSFLQAAPPSIGGTLEFDAALVSMNGRRLIFNTRIDGGNAREAILRTTLR